MSVILWDGRNIQVGGSQISCVLYVAPAKSQCVRGAIHRPASRDRHPTISHTSVGDRKLNLSWVAEKQNPGESVGWKATSVGVGKEMETHLWMRLSYYYYYYCYFFENCVRCCVRCPLSVVVTKACFVERDWKAVFWWFLRFS